MGLDGSKWVKIGQDRSISCFENWFWKHLTKWETFHERSLRLLKLVSNFKTETETLYICLKSWDWYWDFCPGYQKLRLRLRPWSVSNIETDTDTFDFKNKKITLYDPKHTFYVTKKLLKCWHEINFSEGSKICDEQDLQ